MQHVFARRIGDWRVAGRSGSERRWSDRRRSGMLREPVLLGKRLASEVSLSSVLEKALLLQRTLLTGKSEPNVAANQLAQQAVDSENNTLEQEISNLKSELELGRELAGNSSMAIIERDTARGAGSRGIYQGDPTRDRLDQIQKPPSNRNN